MPLSGRLLVVAPDLEQFRIALERAPGVPVVTLDELPATLPVDTVAVLLPHHLLPADRQFPSWSRRIALVVYGDTLAPDEVARLFEAGAFMALPGPLSAVSLQAVHQGAARYVELAGKRDHLQSALTRVDFFGRRISVVENPSALLDYLPNTLSTLLPFDMMAIWDVPQKDLRLFVPFEWDNRQLELATAQVRRILAAQPEAPEPPTAIMRHEFTVTGRQPPPGMVKHFLVARVGAWRGLLAIFRTGDLPFAENDDHLFDLAANLITSALHNARLFEHLERQAHKIIVKNRELLAANQMKANFIANISHELKTPLHSVLGLSELLHEADSPEDLARMVTRIGVNARRLLAIVNDLLDFSRLIANKETLFLEPIALQPLLTEVIDSVRDLADAKGLTLALEIETDRAELNGDREKIFRVLTNLLSNAIKFTPSGQVVCRATSDNKHLRLAVRDTGLGIPDDQLGRIFEQFHRVDGPLHSAAEGTGLGLTIAQGLAKLMGGEITVDSAVGRGSEFALVLPWRGIHTAEEFSAPATPKDGR